MITLVFRFVCEAEHGWELGALGVLQVRLSPLHRDSLGVPPGRGVFTLAGRVRGALPGPCRAAGADICGDCRGGPPPLAESSGYDVWRLPLLPGPPHPARVVSPHGGAGRGGSFRAFKGTIQTLSRFSFRLSDWITCTRAGPGPGAMAGELSPPFDRSPRIAALKDGSGLQFDLKLRVEGPGVLGWQEEELGVLRGTGTLGTCGVYI